MIEQKWEGSVECHPFLFQWEVLAKKTRKCRLVLVIEA